MQHPQRPESNDLIEWEVEDHGRDEEFLLVRPPSSFRQAFGEKPIRLGLVEFRILILLASRPYYAFTRRQIADALRSAELTLSEEAIDGHIATLRDQLGVLHDFVQTVPHVGYRYKA